MSTPNFDEYFDALESDNNDTNSNSENNDTTTNSVNNDTTNSVNKVVKQDRKPSKPPQPEATNSDNKDTTTNGEIIDTTNNEKAQPQNIKCADNINVYKDEYLKTITHEAVDKINFVNLSLKGRSFIEFLLKPQYVHFYIDVDEVNTVEEYRIHQ